MPFRWEKDIMRREIRVPRKLLSRVLQIAHDAKTAGHFEFSKTTSRLRLFHWKHKSKDVVSYVRRCITYQKRNITWK